MSSENTTKSEGKIPDEGIIFYEVKDTDGLPEGEFGSYWTVLDPWTVQREGEARTETVLQAIWLSKSHMEATGFVDKKVEYDTSTRERGLGIDAHDATWTTTAEDELQWFLRNVEHGGVLLQRRLTRIIIEKYGAKCDPCDLKHRMTEFYSYHFPNGICLCDDCTLNMTSSKLLYAALRDTEMSCVPEGIHHITEIYAIVQASYPKWCDDDTLYWNAPEWKHKVRLVLCKFKIKGRVQQDGLERGYWRILLNIRWEEKIGYEATCGGRQWWHRNQKECRVFLYGDIRKIEKGVFENKYMPVDPKTGKKKTSNWCIEPEVEADYRNLKGFPSNHFHNICWDPPHMEYWTSGLISMKYGALEQGSGNYFDDLRRGFMELWRILAPNGTLVFKWNDINIPIHKVLSFFPIDYKYGITSNKAVIIEAGGTAVCIFVKDEESNLIATRTFEEVSEELKSIQTSLLGWD